MTRAAVASLVAILVPLAAALPAAAAPKPPVFNGTVGPGYTISLAKKPAKAGKIQLTVNDRSSSHNFRLRGPGVNVATSVGARGSRTFAVTLKKGTYTFLCDPHAGQMRGTFTIR